MSDKNMEEVKKLFEDYSDKGGYLFNLIKPIDAIYEKAGNQDEVNHMLATDFLIDRVEELIEDIEASDHGEEFKKDIAAVKKRIEVVRKFETGKKLFAIVETGRKFEVVEK